VRLKRSTCAVVIAVCAAVGTALPAAAANGPDTDTVKAVVVKSWGDCGSDSLVWDRLNATWDAYGSVPISIDFSNPLVCGYSFDLGSLEATGADVVILSDPAGIGKHFTRKETLALKAYAGEGHTLIGSYLTFAQDQLENNSRLAPLFGLRKDAGWTSATGIDPTYLLRNKRTQTTALFRDLPKSYASLGYDASQTPGDGTWDPSDMAGAKIVGLNSARTAAITLYNAANYDAIYIANMPEYGGGPQDMQFLYNAVIYPQQG
jgi:hypothetical protein